MATSMSLPKINCLLALSISSQVGVVAVEVEVVGNLGLVVANFSPPLSANSLLLLLPLLVQPMVPLWAQAYSSLILLVCNSVTLRSHCSQL